MMLRILMAVVRARPGMIYKETAPGRFISTLMTHDDILQQQHVISYDIIMLEEPSPSISEELMTRLLPMVAPGGVMVPITPA